LRRLTLREEFDNLIAFWKEYFEMIGAHAVFSALREFPDGDSI
jgi:hypothetical protein